MERYVKQAIQVPIGDLFPDPNNPRLALEDTPGYDDAKALFDETTRKKILEEIGGSSYGIDDLVESISNQGWVNIDGILVWQHPDDPEHWVVTEGNRRLVSLNRIRTIELDKAHKKLERVKAKASSYSKSDLAAAQSLVDRLESIVADTEVLSVFPIDAKTPEDLKRKLPRVLAVRHISHAREWGSYAEDVWLLRRYEHLFADTYGADHQLAWDNTLIRKIAQEASLGDTVAKRKIRAAKWFSHFMAEWEDQLPKGEGFEKSDYYLFENIGKKPRIRQKLGVGEDDMAIPEEGERALFEWVFKEGGRGKADTNPNKFYRHENILVWDQMQRYDEAAGTSFAARFDVEHPEDAPTMQELEAEWLMHKATKKPHAVLDDLLRRLSAFKAEELAAEGEFLKGQLSQVRDLAGKFLKMIDASED